ncbi:MAG TPA: sulfatase-like hydrolase/transferase, partial [Gemmatimonadaceae bacterium]
AYWEVGTFISMWMVFTGVAGAGRELVSTYLASATVHRLIVALLIIVMLAVALDLTQRRPAIVRFVHRLRLMPVMLTVVGAGLVAAAIGFRSPPTPYDESAFQSALWAFARGGVVESLARHRLRHAPPDSLVKIFARTAKAPLPNGPSPYFGRARGYDVLVFIYESLPWTCMTVAGADSALPNLSRLATRGFRAGAHYATYPYSRRAYVSIYGSWYPSNGIRGTIPEFSRVSRELQAPGMVRSAALAGYETAAFVPEEPVALEQDELRYAALGFQHHHVPASAYKKPDFGPDSLEGRRAWLRERDRESFDSLLVEMTRAIKADRRYFYAFHPQLTHGPWPNVAAAMSAEETCRQGLPLYAEVDRQLGEAIDLLERLGRLDRTLIVALGDHGLRTRTEFPAIRPGTLNDATFHVPLMIWAPGVVDSTVTVPWVTSHVDITPSVLDLLGIRQGRALEVGSPMWDPRLRDRTTYFFAREYLGADGYIRPNEAVMFRYLYGGVSRASWDGTLRFHSRDLLRRDDSTAVRVARELELVSAVTYLLSRTMLPELLPEVARGGNERE